MADMDSMMQMGAKTYEEVANACGRMGDIWDSQGQGSRIYRLQSFFDVCRFVPFSPDSLFEVCLDFH
jgi:hypothetical protein